MFGCTCSAYCCLAFDKVTLAVAVITVDNRTLTAASRVRVCLPVSNCTICLDQCCVVFEIQVIEIRS